MLLGRLKTIPRTGWTRYAAITRPESIADHSFRAATMAMFLAEQHGVDQVKVTQMLLLHDLGEALIGDVVTERGKHDLTNLSQKLQDERQALLKILSTINAERYIALFDEFSAKETKEAQFANQLDRLEMAVQAREYELAHDVSVDEFYESTRRRVTDPQLAEILEEVIKSNLQADWPLN